jgi:hypothetical protein
MLERVECVAAQYVELERFVAARILYADVDALSARLPQEPDLDAVGFAVRELLLHAVKVTFATNQAPIAR